MKYNRDLHKFRASLTNHLKTRAIHQDKPTVWEIRESPLGGLGTFACTDIHPGELIYEDHPIIIGPRVVNADMFCVACFAPESGGLSPCSRGCGLPVCSEGCENSVRHRKECLKILEWNSSAKKFDGVQKKLFKCLTPVRGLFLAKYQRQLVNNLHYHKGEEHGHEVRTLKTKFGLQIPDSEAKIMEHVCCVLDANAFEVSANPRTSLRGLYPLASLANHSCIPNAMHVFDENQCMIVKASVFIPKGAEIFHSYTSLLWSTISRRFHLIHTKHFTCLCSRCLDPTEFGTNVNAILCKNCRGGFLLPKDLRTRTCDWECTSCKDVIADKYIGMVISVLGGSFSTLQSEDVQDVRDFLRDRILKIVPECNSTVIEIKYKLIWILGHRVGYAFKAETPTMKRNVPKITALITDHLKHNQLYDDDPPWAIQPSALGGLGTFASRDIHPGEIIYRDAPIVLGPRAVLFGDFFCVSCIKTGALKPCSQGCGLPVCGESCEQSELHVHECRVIVGWNGGRRFEKCQKKVFECLTPVRSLFLSEGQLMLAKCLIFNEGEDHGFEIRSLKSTLGFKIPEMSENLMQFMCSVLDANTFEVLLDNKQTQTSLRGLFPLASFANHRCVPNVIHTFGEDHKMVTRAVVLIPKGDEIFHSYTSLLWNTYSRRFHLWRTKKFLCRCSRCVNASEFGTNMNAILCRKCRGYVLPKELATLKGEWACGSCGVTVSERQIGVVLSVLGATLGNFADRDADEIRVFLKDKLSKVVPGCNSIAVELKYRLIWLLGYRGYSWKDLSDELLKLKNDFCVEILNLLEKLGAGMCKVRGLLLYELFCCKREERRRTGSEDLEDINQLLAEAADILNYDVGAPDEVKLLNQKKQSLRI